MKTSNFPGRKATRRETAKHVNEARAQRSPAQQLAALDLRLGEGVGARRERARLKKQMIAFFK